MPLVNCFSLHGKKTRHWEQISAVVGFPVLPDRELTLKRLIELEVIGCVGQLQEIARDAVAEWEFERDLEAMVGFWREIHLVLVDAVEEQVFSVEQIESLLPSLSEHIMQVDSMKACRFAQFISQKLEYWSGWLAFAQEFLPALVRC